MKSVPQRIMLLLFCCASIIFLSLYSNNQAHATGNQISIGKQIDPNSLNVYTDPNYDVYNHIMIKIRPYKTFRVALKLYMEDGDDIWIYYSSTDNEPEQEYIGGPIQVGLGTSLIDGKWHLLDFDIGLDLESFTVSELIYIKAIEATGNRFDIAYITAYRVLEDESQSNIVIDDFNIPDQNLTDMGWKSETETMSKFSISYDSDMKGYLKADNTTTTQTDTNTTQNATQTPTTYYGYPYSYYGNSAYSGYYGNSSYYGSNYGGLYGSYYGGTYGGYYGGSAYYGGLYSGYGGLSGSYYGGTYGGYYGGSAYYGGLYGGYGGLYGGYGLYGGLYGGYGGYYGGLNGGLLGLGSFGLQNYFGGPIGFY